jgi:SNF2 family DNA or RNA helicase
MTEQIVQCGFTRLHGTPVFVAPPGLPHQDVKRVFGATFMEERSLWLFPAFYPYTANVVRDLKIVFGSSLQFSPEALAHIAECERITEEMKQKPYPFPLREGFEFVTKPYEHQVEALKYALRNLRCGILYDMGLGKTKIAVDLIRHEREKTLILTPVVGIKMWLREIGIHAGPGELKVLPLVGTGKAKKKAKIDEAGDYDVVIVGYDTAKRYAEDIIKAFPYTTIIADESHNLREKSSERTKAACYLASRAARRIIMSGTPSLGNPLHLYGQLHFLAPYIPAKSFWVFRCLYTVQSKYNKKITTGYKNLDHLNDKVQRTCIRKTKEECLELPERTIIDYPFQVVGTQRDLYNQLVIEACASLEAGKLYEAPHAAAVLQKLLQVLSGMFIEPLPEICDGCMYVHSCVEEKIRPYTKRCMKVTTPPAQAVTRLKENPKLDALAELLDEILAEPKNKVIIWGYFKAELDMVQELLEARNTPFVRVDGSNSSQAQDIATRFNTNPDIRVYLGQIATGVALTLTAARYMIYFGLSYSLDFYLQSRDRNYRIGQDEKVFVYRLVCDNSVGQVLVKALEQKIDVANTLTDRIDCLLCRQEKDRDCFVQGIQPFKSGCVYQDKIRRIVTQPEPL